MQQVEATRPAGAAGRRGGEAERLAGRLHHKAAVWHRHKLTSEPRNLFHTSVHKGERSLPCGTHCEIADCLTEPVLEIQYPAGRQHSAKFEPPISDRQNNQLSNVFIQYSVSVRATILYTRFRRQC